MTVNGPKKWKELVVRNGMNCKWYRHIETEKATQNLQQNETRSNNNNETIVFCCRCRRGLSLCIAFLSWFCFYFLVRKRQTPAEACIECVCVCYNFINIFVQTRATPSSSSSSPCLARHCRRFSTSLCCCYCVLYLKWFVFLSFLCFVFCLISFELHFMGCDCLLSCNRNSATHRPPSPIQSNSEAMRSITTIPDTKRFRCV